MKLTEPRKNMDIKSSGEGVMAFDPLESKFDLLESNVGDISE